MSDKPPSPSPAATSGRWLEITPSAYPWEQEALAFIKKRLPDLEPVRAWSNFEFIADDGTISEVDLLVLTAKGLFLVEIKSRPGAVEGDPGTWTWKHEGREFTLDNPILAANRKAKRLKSILMHQKSLRGHRLPFIEPLVFLSSQGLRCRLTPPANSGVALREADAKAQVPGIIDALTAIPPEAYHDPRQVSIDASLARALVRAMDEAGVRRSQKHRRVGDFELESIIFEGPGYQDWVARHSSLPKVKRRLRIFTIGARGGALTRDMIIRAAQREYQILLSIKHPGILRAEEYRDSELGPALGFEYDPDEIRLDHFLANRGASLSVDLRLDFTRQLAEALKHAHNKHLVHRALSPQSILVGKPASDKPLLKIYNWQTAARNAGTSTSLSSTATVHLAELVEEAATVYMAPEALRAPGSASMSLDIFSLGALVYRIFANVPPAETFDDLARLVREGQGLKLASTVDGASSSLCDLVSMATHPDVSRRIGSADEFLELLNVVEEELTRPDVETIDNPIEAKAGDLLEGGIKVKKRLGKGSTAVAFVIEHEGEEKVLKVAIDREHNDRLHNEAQVLEKLRHANIVEVYGVVEVSGLAGILMAKAGEKTLADRIREEGCLSLDLLQRFGEELLQIAMHLEEEGIPHRDIKPANIGIGEAGGGKKLRLILFDFSLARTPAEHIHAGSHPYLDPFIRLRKPPRWDLQAERFAVAMTLYEMAVGEPPRWSDGKSDPYVLDCEVTIESDRFDPAIREALAEFFEQALRRDASERFDNAEEMLKAWRTAFAHIDEPAVQDSVTTEGAVTPALDQATLEMPLAIAGFSNRAVNAMERENVLTIRDLLTVPITRITHMRGVGRKTRTELLEAVSRLKPRFPELANAPALKPVPAADDESVPTSDAYNIDLMVEHVLPSVRSKRANQRKLLAAYTGLEPAEGIDPEVWPTQSEVAEVGQVTRARSNQIINESRNVWRLNAPLRVLREQIVELLIAHGGVMTASELEQAILTRRGSSADEPLRSRRARAVTRAAIETEFGEEAPRWITRRAGNRVFIAMDDHDGEMLAELAIRLGEQADRLACQDPLPSPQRVIEELQKITAASGVAEFTVARLVQLAARSSKAAAVSAKLELYPREMSPARVLRLSQGALLGSRELTIDQIRERVRARYPEAAPLPGRPELDDLLKNAGFELTWDAAAAGGLGAYRVPKIDLLGLSSGSSTLTRYATMLAPAAGLEVHPDVVEAQLIEERLVRSMKEGAFLVLTVAPRYLERVARELAGRFDLEVKSLEALLIREMKAEAAKLGADWNVVLTADSIYSTSPDSEDGRNLHSLLRAALTRVKQELLASEKTILLVRLGLLARFGEMSFLETFRDKAGARPAEGAPRLHGFWALVPADDQNDLPVLDNVPVPVLGRNQWARLTSPWIKNAHRAGIPQ